MRLRRHVIVPILAVLVGPASAHASSGGALAGAPDPTVASASDGDVSVTTKVGGLVGKNKIFRGSVGKADAGRTVSIERFDELSGEWAAITRAPASDDGSFRARWKPDRVGPARVRARVEAPSAAAAAAAPEIDITNYRAAKATWYGPGFYGNRTACKQKMSKTLQGVAHKTLPCGTKVTLLYKGKTVTVPVVDRGPFANGAKWDLTIATAQSLGFTATDTVGALTASK